MTDENNNSVLHRSESMQYSVTNEDDFVAELERTLSEGDIMDIHDDHDFLNLPITSSQSTLGCDMTKQELVRSPENFPVSCSLLQPNTVSDNGSSQGNFYNMKMEQCIFTNTSTTPHVLSAVPTPLKAKQETLPFSPSQVNW